MTLFGFFGDAYENVKEHVQHATDELHDKNMRSFVLHDTKVHAFNLATVSAITFVALAIISGLTTGNGFAFCLSAGILSLAIRKIIQISIEKDSVAANLFAGLKQSMIKDEETEILSKIFKVPCLSFKGYKNNFHLLFRKC